MRGLKGKTAIVTGGASGLGLAMARGLAGAGAKVVIADRNRDGAEAVSREIEADGGQVVAFEVDVVERTTA